MVNRQTVGWQTKRAEVVCHWLCQRLRGGLMSDANHVGFSIVLSRPFRGVLPVGWVGGP